MHQNRESPGLTNGHRTIGRSLSTGRGATAAAFARRATRRLAFLPGYFPKCQNICPSSNACPSAVNSGDEPGRSGTAHASANPCGNLWVGISFAILVGLDWSAARRRRGFLLTVVGDLLIVLDRLEGELSSATEISVGLRDNPSRELPRGQHAHHCDGCGSSPLDCR
jgi:hypothetical protein